MNKKFTEVYTTDDVWLSLRIDWDSNEDYYITYLECEDASELQLHSIKCKFLEFSPLNNTLIFVDDFGIKHEIDPVDEHTRDSIRIYSIISYSILEKVSWFEIAIIPFDRNFFKLGRCYMVKETRTEDPKPMMLIEMDFDHMHFICVADPDRFKDPGINHIYVKAERYKRMRKPYWFQALMEGDVWSNDKYKEMAEDNIKQETGSEEIS
ncbi:MAG: hypothetical protein IKU29_04145 [Parabacteroides sp.]|nr:hypothetical protein [Parabacteroides sp.]